MTADELDALLERALQFRMLKLPGQPMAMHMGTSYLVRDMERAITALRAELAAMHDTRRMLWPLIEKLIGEYWDIAYDEGATGIVQAEKANEVIHAIERLVAP